METIEEKKTIKEKPNHQHKLTENERITLARIYGKLII